MRKLKMLWRNRSRLLPLMRYARPVFSQFGEDLAITKLLRPSSKGTYVDVGANDPFNGSNTAYLYTLGWSGLAIDPNPAFSAAFKNHRPRDVHLTMGVSESAAELTYYEFSHAGLNTFCQERAQQLTNQGTEPIRSHPIPCRPLHKIIEEHLPGRHIDLLSVDCEGLDLQVLKSANLAQLRPTVLVVEDFMRYVEFRDAMPAGEFDRYLRSISYSPIFQSAWSAIYVANEWRDLPPGAFRPPEDLYDYMPKPST